MQGDREMRERRRGNSPNDGNKSLKTRESCAGFTPQASLVFVH
jgi:hypothetical protein